MLRPRVTSASAGLFLAVIPALAFASPDSAGGFGFDAPPAAYSPRGAISTFAVASPFVEDGRGDWLAARGMGATPGRRPRRPRAQSGRADSLGGADSLESREGSAPPAEGSRRAHLPRALSPERARLMLQSLTVPGWGQATLGHRKSAMAFGLMEVGVWGSFTAFRIQERMRRSTYEKTAELYAGIDLSGRDEEFRRIVGFFISSDEYNRLVVRRDAANLYYGNPAAYDAYVAAHELKGIDTWSWDSEESFRRYRMERQAQQRSTRRAQTALAVAVINRLLSAIHVASAAAHDANRHSSWRLECVPAGGDPTAYRLGVRADF